MLDEAYMRQWNEHHVALSEGIDRLVARIHRHHGRHRKGIDETYAVRPVRGYEARGSQTGTSLLSGLAAVVLTAVIFSSGIATVTAAQTVVADSDYASPRVVELA